MQLSPEVKVGFTILLSLVLLASMTMAIGRLDFGKPVGYELEVLYQSVDGLRDGAPVRFAGVNVGKVSAVILDTQGVLVRLRVERELPIPVDSRFVISSAGVLGDKHVEIHPGTAQQAIEAGTTIAGVNPVALDSILGEVHTTLHNLNSVVLGFANIADSKELKDSIVDSGVLLKETAASLKTAVDNVNLVTQSIQGISTQVEVVTLQLSQAPVQEMVNNIDKFTKELGALELGTMVDDLQTFTTNLKQVPIKEISDDLQMVSRQLASFDFSGLEKDVKQFTGQLATLDMQPLMTEITEVTRQLSALELERRGQELAVFTGKLADFPIDQLGKDIQEITAMAKDVPIPEISNNLVLLSEQLANLPVVQIMDDLQKLTTQVRGLGWDQMAEDLNQFTSNLASLDVAGMLDEATADLKGFSKQFSQVDMVSLFDELNGVVLALNNLTSAVEPESVRSVVADLQAAAGNVNTASVQFNTLLAEVSGDADKLLTESGVTITMVQEAVVGIQAFVDDINAFVKDLTAEGETAGSVREALDSVKKTTQGLEETIGLVNTGIPLTAETFDSLRKTMDSINKINADIQSIKGMGEKVDIESKWGLGFNYAEDRLAADVQFRFIPEELPAFFVVGWDDIGGANNFQLQYGKATDTIRQRYGLIDTKLGVGLDGIVSDKIVISADLRDIKQPKLRLGAQYQWTTDWWMYIKANDVFKDDGGVNLGIERRF